ncbi:30S ribosomal protein S4 [Candidatus Dojkabacteria bacterium]|uniref:Small ribosomal subunit protein uS4 n=1 Tax=Candidatus Dojkabacteria bacterium TaxID=2099670 RepID=A0A955LC95_9BACT|nr:30S ribosomal protein S4 [Candidatus Dojkabacteria bacterium]
MARYTGPKWRINRRENAVVKGTSEKWRKRPTAPGMHGHRRSRYGEYMVQFREKQKVKRTYGMLEKQFRRFFKLARKSTGNTGTRLLQLLELRLDNVVFRLGFANTRDQARQLVTHGHITLNGKKHNIPSTILNAGDEIAFTDKFSKTDIFKLTKEELSSVPVPEWLSKLAKGGKVTAEPTREMMDPSIREQLIIELYSK